MKKPPKQVVIFLLVLTGVTVAIAIASIIIDISIRGAFRQIPTEQWVTRVTPSQFISFQVSNDKSRWMNSV
jgi:hypothetical protein